MCNLVAEVRPLTICFRTTNFNVKVRRQRAIGKLFVHNMLKVFDFPDGTEVNVSVGDPVDASDVIDVDIAM